MNELTPMQSFGLTLPSPAYLLGAILFGIVGLVAFRRGKKISSATLKWTGVALMLYPYVVTETWMMWAVGIGLCAWVYARWN